MINMNEEVKILGSREMRELYRTCDKVYDSVERKWGLGKGCLNDPRTRYDQIHLSAQHDVEYETLRQFSKTVLGKEEYEVSVPQRQIISLAICTIVDYRRALGSDASEEDFMEIF